MNNQMCALIEDTFITTASSECTVVYLQWSPLIRRKGCKISRRGVGVNPQRKPCYTYMYM